MSEGVGTWLDTGVMMSLCLSISLIFTGPDKHVLVSRKLTKAHREERKRRI